MVKYFVLSIIFRTFAIQLRTINTMTHAELKQIIENNQNIKEFKVISINGKSAKMRLFISTQDVVCYFPKGKRTYGYAMDNAQLNCISSCEPIIKDEFKIVKRFLQNVVKYLSASGLWVNIKEDYIKILAQGDDYLKKAINLGFSEQRQFLEATIGVSSFHVDNIVYSALKGIKSINYDKYERNYRRDWIGNRMKDKDNFRFYWRNGYDCSVEFREDSVGNYLGWYSEEYVGCGNGYYYLALDEKRAIFVEKD